MRALWLEDRRLRLRDDVPIPAPPSGEALVRVIRAGICNTDIELTQGYYPFTGIPGHEFGWSAAGSSVRSTPCAARAAHASRAGARTASGARCSAS